MIVLKVTKGYYKVEEKVRIWGSVEYSQSGAIGQTLAVTGLNAAGAGAIATHPNREFTVPRDRNYHSLHVWRYVFASSNSKCDPALAKSDRTRRSPEARPMYL